MLPKAAQRKTLRQEGRGSVSVFALFTHAATPKVENLNTLQEKRKSLIENKRLFEGQREGCITYYVIQKG